MTREATGLTRVPYETKYAREVISWPRDARELAMWTSRRERPTEETLRAWSETAGGEAFVFLQDGVPCAYAELWEEPDDDEAEVARVIVAPSHRRRGVARAVVGSLAEEARSRGYGNVVLRVVPENEGAIACYGQAGFVRASEELAAILNEGQPQRYVWMSYAGV